MFSLVSEKGLMIKMIHHKSLKPGKKISPAYFSPLSPPQITLVPLNATCKTLIDACKYCMDCDLQISNASIQFKLGTPVVTWFSQTDYFNWKMKSLTF